MICYSCKCSLGRTDVGRTSSMNELCTENDRKATTSSTQSLNATQRLSSLFNPLRWSRRNVNETTTTPQSVRRSTTRKGPAARKCNRSTGNLHRPSSISPASSVFFLSPAGEETSARTSATVDEEQSNSMNYQGQPQSQLQQQSQPVLIGSAHRRQTTAPQTPQTARQLGPFAGIRPQLLPSQLSPMAL